MISLDNNPHRWYTQCASVLAGSYLAERWPVPAQLVIHFSQSISDSLQVAYALKIALRQHFVAFSLALIPNKKAYYDMVQIISILKTPIYWFQQLFHEFWFLNKNVSFRISVPQPVSVAAGSLIRRQRLILAKKFLFLVVSKPISSFFLAYCCLIYTANKKAVQGITYRNSQKHESTLLHKYVLNKFLTADRSCTTKYF